MGAVADHLHTLTTAIRRAVFPGLGSSLPPSGPALSELVSFIQISLGEIFA